MHTLHVDSSQQCIVDSSGRRFFYLADTAWELLHRLSISEADLYLRTRAAQQFNVIQTVALAELDGLKTPNANGDLPLHHLDPATPNEAYFSHVDRVIDLAMSLGMYTALLPTWGDKVSVSWGVGPVVFNEVNARQYGRWLGTRYCNASIIWVIGGDRPVRNDGDLRIWRSMAEGLREGDGGRGLMTFHPNGGASSSQFVHAEPWLDFNMIQSGHTGRDTANWDFVAADLKLLPAKPTLDGEPNYENHPVMGSRDGQWLPVDGDQWFNDYDARKAAYRSVFSGACGHTYGCHDVWQMFDPARSPAINNSRTPWPTAIELPGAWQMQHLKKLVESRWPTAGPLTAKDAGLKFEHDAATAADHTILCRAGNGTSLMAYLPHGGGVSIDSKHFRRDNNSRFFWHNPRTGAIRSAVCTKHETDIFFPPENDGSDWVFVIDQNV